MSNDPANYDRTIDELVGATLPLNGSELTAIVQDGVTKSAPVSALLAVLTSALPTSSTGLPSGALWYDGTRLRVVP